MGLVPITVDIRRDAAATDAYYGETLTPGTVYSGLNATFNYPSLRSREERFEATSGGGLIGPGVQTKTRGIVIFDPKPSVTVAINDHVIPNPAVHGVPADLLVVGVREYEFTLQLDVYEIG